MTLPVNKKTYKNLFPSLSIDGINVLDIWRAWTLTEDFKSKIKIFGTYFLSEGDRWDTISEEVYGSREYWWILVMFNDVEDPFSIYFDKTITGSLKYINMPKESDIGYILNEIRRKRLEFEVSDDEETV